MGISIEKLSGFVILLVGKLVYASVVFQQRMSLEYCSEREAKKLKPRLLLA